MKIPRGFSEELLNQADIARVVSDYVTLKKKGRDFAACCPFHQEKTPSFYVSPSKQIFKCFGCGKGGNIFNFVMEIEGASFAEAIQIVAEKSGITIPVVNESPNYEARNRERDDIRQLNQWAVEFFEKSLCETSEGHRAQEYLESRGISEQMRQKFRLGYAPDAWDALSTWLQEHGATRTQIEKSGLVTLKESGNGFYDKFRGRLMFPICDTQQRVIAFGGRLLGQGEPKYLNSPETTLYTKGQNLYGLSHAREFIRRTGFVILVEGYLDFLIPFQYGVRNLVASLGTALTEQQVRLLARYTEKRHIVVNFDPDNAGVNATKRSLEMLLKEGFKVNVLSLPDNLDPDEYIRGRGAESYYRLLKTSLPYLDYVVEQAIQDHDQTRPTGKVETLNAILPYMKMIGDRVELAEQCERVADRLKIESRLIRDELKKAVQTRREKVSERVLMASATIKPAERKLLEILLNHAGLRHRLMRQIREEDYAGLRTAELFRLLAEFENQGLEPSWHELSSRLDDEDLAQELLPQLMLGDVFSTDEGEDLKRLAREAQESLDGLRFGWLAQQQATLQAEINQAQRAGDLALVNDLTMKKLALARQERTLGQRMQ
jgi:DNA primase